MTLSSLGLSAPLLRAAADQGYEDPTPVQTAVIPEVLAGRDVWAKASTGTGKTAAFVLPILQMLGPLTIPRRVKALVLVPTRDLAKQTLDVISALRAYLPKRPKAVVVLGGVSINPQMMELRGGADIIVATPGRLLDLVEKNALSLGTVQQLVLDEADRLMDNNFRDELMRIVELLPASRQTMLFSATFSPAVAKLEKQLMREPVRIAIGEQVTEVPLIAQRAIEVDAPRRTQLLRHLIETHEWERVLVFVATTHATDHVAAKLCGAGINAIALSGEMSQGARTKALDMFRASRVHVLVATDLASRGLDITGLPAVINYDVPRSATDYVHRIGRTGRAGVTGVAVSFVTAETSAHFAVIEKRHKHRVPRERIAGFEPTQAPVAPSSAGGVKGARMSKKDKLRAKRL
ncbi:MAG: DEAD/DEAH box helicase [Deltaproteobacteria bacterium]|nr:DEAD/DEAH box helicase [Deltaproteobacteria bacterium]